MSDNQFEVQRRLDAAARAACTRCAGTGWVCEAHPDRPWSGEHACGAAGEPCPDCNSADVPRTAELLDAVEHIVGKTVN